MSVVRGSSLDDLVSLVGGFGSSCPARGRLNALVAVVVAAAVVLLKMVGRRHFDSGRCAAQCRVVGMVREEDKKERERAWAAAI